MIVHARYSAKTEDQVNAVVVMCIVGYCISCPFPVVVFMFLCCACLQSVQFCVLVDHVIAELT